MCVSICNVRSAMRPPESLYLLHAQMYGAYRTYITYYYVCSAIFPCPDLEPATFFLFLEAGRSSRRMYVPLSLLYL